MTLCDAEIIRPCAVCQGSHRSPGAPGKSLSVVRRLAAHNRLRCALHHWAAIAVQHDTVSQAKYQALRERGHGHARALRSVADRLLAVACAMLETQTLFDPSRTGHNHAT